MTPSAPDIRWRQHLANYDRVLGRLSEAMELARTRPLTDLEKRDSFRPSGSSMNWLGIS